MNVIDKLVEAVSPGLGLARLRARSALEAQRNYDAAAPDRLNEGWRAIGASGQITDSMSRDRLRNRARDLERNSDFLNGILSAYERNVIGEGLKLQAKTDSADTNARIEKLWKEWCRAENCDVTGQQSFEAITRMLLRRKIVDGGILVYFVRDRHGKYPLKLQIIEVDALCDGGSPTKKGNRIVDGVEVDKAMRHVGYWVNQTVDDGFTVGTPKFIPAEDVAFYWNRTRPSQVREVSELAHTLSRIRDANSFMTYIAEKERTGAGLTAAVKVEGASQVGMGRGPTPPTPYAKPNSGAGVRKTTIEPGTLTYLEPGESVETIKGPDSASSAAEYVKLQQRLMGTGQGLGYESISRDMKEVNYSSARQSLIEDRATYLIEKDILVGRVLERVYTEFVSAMVFSGQLNAPSYLSDKEAMLRHIWVSPAKPWIDPVKEAQANRIALETNQKTLTQIVAESGRDIEDIVAELAAEKELFKTLGEEDGQE